MSVIYNNFASSETAFLVCYVILNYFFEGIPYYLLEIPYLFNLFFDRREKSLVRKVPSSKFLQFFSVLIFRLTRPIIFQLFFQELNLDSLFRSIIDVIIIGSIFYTIPFKYWQALKNNRISGNIINTLDAFGAADVNIQLVQRTLRNASLLQYIFIVLLSNSCESIMSWIMYKNEGSDESLLYFLLSIQQTLLLEIKSSFINIFCFAFLHSQTKISKLVHRIIYSNFSLSSNTSALEYLTNFIYVNEAIKAYNPSPSTSSPSQEIINVLLSAPHKQLKSNPNFQLL